MHKYRAAAKQAAWYNEESDSSNYNPFRKARSYEHETNDFRILHRAQPLHFSGTVDQERLDEDGHEDEDVMDQYAEMAPHTKRHRERRNLIRIRKPRDEEQGRPSPPRAFASWMSWSQQKLSYVWRQMVLVSGSRRSGDVKRSVADMGMSVISHAPLGTKGAPFLQFPGRRSRFMVIEYANYEGDITKNSQDSADIIRDSTKPAIRAVTDVRTGVPLLRFYERQSRRDDDKDILDDHQTKSDVKSLCTELLELLSTVGKPPNLSCRKETIEYSPIEASISLTLTNSENHVRRNDHSHLSFVLIDSQIYSGRPRKSTLYSRNIPD